MSPTPRREAWPFSFEKWYIDTLLPDGSVLIVYLGRMHLLGLSLGRVNAELLRPGRPPIKGHAIARRVHGEGDTLRFGSAIIDGEWLSFKTAGLSGAAVLLNYLKIFASINISRAFKHQVFVKMSETCSFRIFVF